MLLASLHSIESLSEQDLAIVGDLGGYNEHESDQNIDDLRLIEEERRRLKRENEERERRLAKLEKDANSVEEAVEGYLWNAVLCRNKIVCLLIIPHAYLII